MKSNTPPARRSKPSRCTVCKDPDRDTIDRDLTLGERSQAEIAASMGLHPSTVSRHYRRHAQPNLAMDAATGRTSTAIGTLIGEHDRLYGICLEVLVASLIAGDLRLSRDMIAETRKLLVVITDLQKAIGDGKLRDLQDRDQFDLEAARATFKAKLDKLAANYRRAPDLLAMIDAMEAGADQEEVNRLMRKAGGPPEVTEPTEGMDPSDQADSV
jgi:putative hemolysin